MNPTELFRQETGTLELAPGDFLFQEGDTGENMYVLLEGEIEIFLGDFMLETAEPGMLIGEMAPIDNGPRTANAVAKPRLPTGGNRSTTVLLSRSAASAFCDMCDEDAG